MTASKDIAAAIVAVVLVCALVVPLAEGMGGGRTVTGFNIDPEDPFSIGQRALDANDSWSFEVSADGLFINGEPYNGRAGFKFTSIPIYDGLVGDYVAISYITSDQAFSISWHIAGEYSPFTTISGSVSVAGTTVSVRPESGDPFTAEFEFMHAGAPAFAWLGIPLTSAYCSGDSEGSPLTAVTIGQGQTATFPLLEEEGGVSIGPVVVDWGSPEGSFSVSDSVSEGSETITVALDYGVSRSEGATTVSGAPVLIYEDDSDSYSCDLYVGWMAPIEWSYTEDAPYSAIVQIIPVVLLAALIAGLAASVARRGP